MVSIIIPVYNSADFLDRTLKSVLGQIYENIEILLVNDGSTDESGVVCDQYKKEDSRIRVIHKENGGVSTARNIGLYNMKGEFCQFVDSDDVIPENYTKILVERLEESRCDAAFCGVEKIWDNKRYLLELSDEVYSTDEYIYELYKGDKFATKSACVGIYKTDIIKSGNVTFPENVHCGEDSIFIMEYIKHCKAIRTVHGTVYNYMHDNVNSATSAVYYDHFLVEMQRYKLANRIIKDKGIKESVAQFYMNSEIRELLQYVIYSEEKYSVKIETLKRFVNNLDTKYAIRFYRRDDKKKSLLIPVMIRNRVAFMLYFALKYRGRYLQKENFKKVKVKSLYS